GGGAQTARARDLGGIAGGVVVALDAGWTPGVEHDRRQVRPASRYPRANRGRVVPCGSDDLGRAVTIGAAEQAGVGAEHKCDLLGDRGEYLGWSSRCGDERRDAPQRTLLVRGRP